MTKRKSKQKKNQKKKLHIPRTVEEARRTSDRYIPAGWDNAPLIKTKPEQFDQDQIKELARAIYEYMSEKDMKNPGGSWQDFILVSLLQHVYMQSAIRDLISTKGESPRMAELKVVYESLPPEVSASDEEIEQIITKLKKKKKSYEDIAYDEIVAEIAKLRGVSVDVKTLKKKGMLAEIEKVVDSLLKKHTQSKWLIFIEGILLGLISNGLFELLKKALASLVMRAPYTEAQIYEIETDVIRSFETWLRSVDKPDYLEDEESEITLFYVLHAVCVLSVLGLSVPYNPLFDETRIGNPEEV